jgi:hypothetical protein
MSNTRAEIVAAALESFWETVTELSGAATGDLDVLTTVKFTRAATDAVGAFILANVPDEDDADDADAVRADYEHDRRRDEELERV